MEPPLSRIRHVRQPDGSSLCAHSCLAMILNVSLEEAVSAMGHRRGTRTRELVRALGRHALAPRLVTLKRGGALPEIAVLRVVWRTEPKKRKGHMVLKVSRAVHDPLSPVVLQDGVWSDWISSCEARVTSYLPVSLPY